MKVHTETRVETTEIVEMTFNMEEIKNILMHYYEDVTTIGEMDCVEACVREYDGEVQGPSVVLYGWKTSKNGEY